MGNTGLGTTIPIDSWVQNYNSHQSPRPGVLLVARRGGLCWLLNPPHSQSQGGGQTLPGLPGQAGAVTAQCRAACWVGGAPARHDVPRGDWVWGLVQISSWGAAIGGEQSWEGRLTGGGIPGLYLMLPAGEKGAAPERERPDWQGRGGPWVPTQKCGVWNGTGGASEQVGGGWEELRSWCLRLAAGMEGDWMWPDFPVGARGLGGVLDEPLGASSLAWVSRDFSLLLCSVWHLGCWYWKAGDWGRCPQGRGGG